MKTKAISVIILTMVISVNLRSQEIPKEYKEIMNEYYEVVNVKKSYLNIIDLLFSSFKTKYSNEIIPDEFWVKIQNEFIISVDDILIKLTEVYYKYYSIEDIEKIIEFYKSEIGQKLLKNQISIQNESYHIGAEFGQNITKKVLEELKKEGYLKK